MVVLVVGGVYVVVVADREVLGIDSVHDFPVRHVSVTSTSRRGVDCCVEFLPFSFVDQQQCMQVADTIAHTLPYYLLVVF